MSVALLSTLQLEHWCDVARAHALAKDVYWHLIVVVPASAALGAAPAGGLSTCIDMALVARIDDAFAFTPERPRDVIAAFEAMLLAGEVARAYEYARGGVDHSFTSFSKIRCDHTPDYAQTKGSVVLARHAVRIAEAVVDHANSMTVTYEARDTRELVDVRGNVEILRDLGLVT